MPQAEKTTAHKTKASHNELFAGV